MKNEILGNETESCSRMYTEGKCSYQPNTGEKGKEIYMEIFWNISNINTMFQWHALTREEQAKYYEAVSDNFIRLNSCVM